MYKLYWCFYLAGSDHDYLECLHQHCCKYINICNTLYTKLDANRELVSIYAMLLSVLIYNAYACLLLFPQCASRSGYSVHEYTHTFLWIAHDPGIA